MTRYERTMIGQIVLSGNISAVLLVFMGFDWEGSWLILVFSGWSGAAAMMLLQTDRFGKSKKLLDDEDFISYLIMPLIAAFLGLLLATISAAPAIIFSALYFNVY